MQRNKQKKTFHLKKIRRNHNSASRPADSLHVPAGFQQQRLCCSSGWSLENDPLSLQSAGPRVSETGRVHIFLYFTWIFHLNSIWNSCYCSDDPAESTCLYQKVFIELLRTFFSSSHLFSQKVELAKATAALQREREAQEAHKQQQKQVFREQDKTSKESKELRIMYSYMDIDNGYREKKWK